MSSSRRNSSRPGMSPGTPKTSTPARGTPPTPSLSLSPLPLPTGAVASPWLQASPRTPASGIGVPFNVRSFPGRLPSPPPPPVPRRAQPPALPSPPPLVPQARATRPRSGRTQKSAPTRALSALGASQTNAQQQQQQVLRRAPSGGAREQNAIRRVPSGKGKKGSSRKHKHEK